MQKWIAFYKAFRQAVGVALRSFKQSFQDSLSETQPQKKQITQETMRGLETTRKTGSHDFLIESSPELEQKKAKQLVIEPPTTDLQNYGQHSLDLRSAHSIHSNSKLGEISGCEFTGGGALGAETFWSYLDSFLKVQNSPHTRRAYEKDVEDFLAYLKQSSQPLSIHVLVQYREHLKTTPSPKTGEPLTNVSINRKTATLKSFLNWLVVNGVIPNNPAKAVKSFRAGRESPTRDIPDDRVHQMLQLPARHKTAGRMHHAMLMILFHLGLRRAELVGLRTSDIFEQEGMRVIRVRGKGDKERVLPIPPEVSKSIDTYLEFARKDISVDQPLFSPVKNNITKTKDKPLHPNAVAYVVKHYAKLAGVHYRVSPHSARATAVSNALDNKAPQRAVQYMAGWSSPLMVTRYDKRKQDLKNSAVKFVKYDESDEDEMSKSHP